MRFRPAGPGRATCSRRPRAVVRLARHASLAVVVLAVAAGCLPGGTAGGAPSATGVPASAPATADAARSPAVASPSTSGEPAGPPAGQLPPASPPAASPAYALPTTRRLPEVPRAALDVRLEQVRARLGIPGVSAAILWGDGRRWLGAAGLADVDAGRPVTTGTAFALASVSKTYTAAVVLELVDDGRLALDTPVAPLLPDLGISLDPTITVRMLLTHTSGLTDYFFHPQIDRLLTADRDAAWSVRRTLRFLPGGSTTPGTQFRYSNTNYLLLGLVAEAVTGRPLGELVRTRLLAPLGLEATWTQIAEDPRAPLARGYRLVGSGRNAVARPVGPAGPVQPYVSVVSAAGGAGGIAATAADAATWMAALVTGDVVSPELRARMVRGADALHGPEGGVPYGLGVQAVRLGGWVAIGHSGRYSGFRTVVRHVPAQRLTIAVLTNQGSVDPALVAAALLDVVATRPQCERCPADR